MLPTTPIVAASAEGDALRAYLWYWGTFSFGLLILLLFSWRKFNEIILPPDKNLTVLLSGLTVSSISTRGQSLRGFAGYFFGFGLAYTGLCICQPLAAWSFQVSTGQKLADAWASPAGPLVVLSLLVGVVPNLKVVDEFEKALRRISQRIAGIPDDILDVMDTIRSLPIDAEASRDISSETRQLLSSLNMIVAVLRYSEVDRKSLMTAILHANLLGPWIYGPGAPVIWSGRILSRLTVPRSLVSVEANQYIADLEVLIRDWDRHLQPALDVVLADKKSSFLEIVNDSSMSITPLLREAVDVFIRDNDEALDDVKIRMLKVQDDVQIVSDHCDCLFAILATGDEKRRDDVGSIFVKTAISQLKRASLGHILDPIIFSSLIGSLSCLVVAIGLRTVKSIARHDTVDSSKFISATLNLGLNNSIALLFLFTIPVLAAVTIRYWGRGYRPLFRKNEPFPVSRVFYLLVAVFIVAALFQVVYYLGSQLIYVGPTPNVKSQMSEIFYTFFFVILLQQIALSLVGCFLAMAVCYIFDIGLFGTGNDGVGGGGRIGASIFTVSLVVVLLLMFVAVQVKLFPPYYFADRVDESGIVVKWYDNITGDCTAIGVFLLVFVSTLLHQVTYLRAQDGR
ncbi:hypothetical protein FJ970_10630 [Mesorhizobium sp. B2-1-8]|uniref:hypothetical protein n=1 Tax=Mesorhizobium sp. B2-1-8 TaxID=2589967 RepID=UPI0011294840|nr:hypothetical protein [Mesorhizobium sp. B2-1-8]UCI21375.1 hypothetical protein FJ970_10630 [Mesorhizobium sp. B2-1-8]